MYVLGLTGSIGMGKTTTAKLFADEGVPVHDADAAVHALYEAEAVAPIEKEFPGTTSGGKVDRDRLGRMVVNDPVALRRLEEIVHPLVRVHEQKFLADARARGAPVVVLDIPLLFETDGRNRVDMVAVVTAPPEVQRERVLSRPGMTEEKFNAILAKQVPDAEKRRMADFVIDTGRGMEAARDQVADIIEKLTGRRPQAAAAKAS